MSWITTAGAGAAVVAATWSGAASGSRPVRPATWPTACAAVTVALRPGLNPPWPRFRIRPARDIPRRAFSAWLPAYPKATPLASYIASPFPSVPADRYLQSGSVEYRVAARPDAVLAWVSRALRGCGWRPDGSWTTNASAFTSGLTFAARTTRDLTVAISVGDDGAGGAYLGYGVLETTLPRRPASSYLRGPFSQVRIVLRTAPVDGSGPARYVRVTVGARPAIVQLVRAINAIRGRRSVLPVCAGGVGGSGPAWLSFVKANGTMVHAFERGPGACNGLAVNGIRWLTDDGPVWQAVLTLTRGRGE